MNELTTDYSLLVDVLIDKLEKEYGSNSNLFIAYDETKEGGGEIEEDEYIIGGNHGLYLYTGGCFAILPQSTEKLYYTTYDGTEKTKDNEPDTRSIAGWKNWFVEHGDKEEYHDFDEWLLDMISSGVLSFNRTETFIKNY